MTTTMTIQTDTLFESLADSIAAAARRHGRTPEAAVKHAAGILSASRQQQLVEAVTERLSNTSDWIAERNA